MNILGQNLHKCNLLKRNPLERNPLKVNLLKKKEEIFHFKIPTGSCMHRSRQECSIRDHREVQFVMEHLSFTPWLVICLSNSLFKNKMPLPFNRKKFHTALYFEKRVSLASQ